MRLLRSQPRRSDRGTTAVLVAGAMLLLLGAAAIAIDLAALRFDLRADRLASDAAATAGVNAIDPLSGSNAAAACEVAWEYVLINLPDDESGQAPECGEFSGSCDSESARIAWSEAGPYKITFTHPVPNDHALMGTQDLNPEIDGVPCQRFGVTVERLRDFTFARVLGFGGGTTVANSVARITPDVGEGDVVPLVVLEPYECGALVSPAGKGRITIVHFEDSPGIIVADSAGSQNCGPNNPYIIQVKAPNGWIRALPVPGPGGAQSAILSYALSGQPNTFPSRAYDLSDTTTGIDPNEVEDDGGPETWFRLYPTPQFRSQRVTRAPIDHRYNCKASYPDYLPGVPIAGCTDPDGGAHIDALKGQYGGPLAPVGFQNWTDFHSCTINEGTIEVTGNWWVNCQNPQGFIINPSATPDVYELYTDATGGTFTLSDGTDTTSAIAFNASATDVENTIEADIAAITDVRVTGAGTAGNPWIIEFVDPQFGITLACDGAGLTGTCVLNQTEEGNPGSAVVKFIGGDVVFRGRVDVRAHGELHINPSPSEDHVVVIRAGNLLKRAQSTIRLEQTFVYLMNGAIDLGGGAGGLVWTAPIGGVFEDLALWSESPAEHGIGGQAGNTLTGTFFTPYANPFSLTGQAGQFQTDAQFVTRKLEVKGQGKVLMAPDPDRQTLIPVRGVLLIR